MTSSSGTMRACSWSSVGTSLACGVFPVSASGVCSWGDAALGSMKHSETNHLFSLVGGVSSTSSPYRVLAMIAGELSVLGQSSASSVYSSSVSHSVSLSKFGDVDHCDLASVHAYSTIGSTGEGGAGVGPTGTTDGQGQKFPRSQTSSGSHESLAPAVCHCCVPRWPAQEESSFWEITTG